MQAGVEVVVKNATFPSSIGHTVEPKAPAMPKARSGPGDLFGTAVRANVSSVVEDLLQSGFVLQLLLSEGKLMMVGGR